MVIIEASATEWINEVAQILERECPDVFFFEKSMLRISAAGVVAPGMAETREALVKRLILIGKTGSPLAGASSGQQNNAKQITGGKWDIHVSGRAKIILSVQSDYRLRLYCVGLSSDIAGDMNKIRNVDPSLPTGTPAHRDYMKLYPEPHKYGPSNKTEVQVTLEELHGAWRVFKQRHASSGYYKHQGSHAFVVGLAEALKTLGAKPVALAFGGSGEPFLNAALEWEGVFVTFDQWEKEIENIHADRELLGHGSWRETDFEKIPDPEHNADSVKKEFLAILRK